MAQTLTKPLVRPIKASTGTTYTVLSSDNEKLVTLGSASATSVVLPTDAAQAIPIGGFIDFFILGAGVVTYSAAGATLRSNATAKGLGQYSGQRATKIAADTWALTGQIALS